MKIGLVGLAQSGKSTLFCALTGAASVPANFGGDKTEQNVAVVKVGDERVSRLSELYKPKKTVYATIDLVDFSSVAESESKDTVMESDLMRIIRNMDALALVVRGFANEYLPEPTPVADVEKLVQEFFLADLVITEKRLEKIEAGYKRGIKTPVLQSEEKVLRRILEQLNAVQPVRDLEFTPDEERVIRGFQFLTKKPLLVILNSDESNFGKQHAVAAAIKAMYPMLEFAGRFEMELAGLSAEDARMFMADMGITASARDTLTRALYEMLGYISFFTVGEDEVRAWTIRKASNAVEAAGAIHSDLARGFIRAECFLYDDLIALGSEKAIREKGKFRLEGKEYIVQDGDIINIRFNV
jgi:GTP-binding protein YchF